ncbi:DUF4190 domain-containing protein [Streptomyces sp. NPDC049915]|uniref:DUF4190 domain-containing protein n=1 Tax=Streptomyces sp. NPDC049915 TaxID=3155510 RepID=UPI00341B27ED
MADDTGAPGILGTPENGTADRPGAGESPRVSLGKGPAAGGGSASGDSPAQATGAASGSGGRAAPWAAPGAAEGPGHGHGVASSGPLAPSPLQEQQTFASVPGGTDTAHSWPEPNPFAPPPSHHVGGAHPFAPPQPGHVTDANPFAPPAVSSSPGEPVPPPPIAPDGPGQVPYGYPGPLGYPGAAGGAHGPQAHGYPAGYYGWPGMQPLPSNGMGTAGLVLGIIGAVIFCAWPLAIIAGALGVIFGAIGRSKAKRGEATNPGQALAGIICGAAGIVLGVGFLILVIATS